MGNWLGSGPPRFIVDGAGHTYPPCISGGREETWKLEVDESWVNSLGEIIEGDRKFRFEASYTWPTLTTEQVRQLKAWLNGRVRIQVQPHADLGEYRVLCRVLDVETKKGATVAHQDVVTLKVQGVALVDTVPIPSGELMGFGSKPKKGVIA